MAQLDGASSHLSFSAAPHSYPSLWEMPGPCTLLGSWGGVERRQGLPWAIFCALLPQGRLSEGQRESTVRSCRHISRSWEVAEERSLWAADRPSFSSSSSSHPLRAEFGCRALKIVLGSPPRRVCRVSSWQSCTVWFSFNPDLFLCSPSLSHYCHLPQTCADHLCCCIVRKLWYK